jgi:hypothetical protein
MHNFHTPPPPLGRLYTVSRHFLWMPVDEENTLVGLSTSSSGLEPIIPWIRDRITVTIREVSRPVISGTMGPYHGYMNERLSLL